MAELLKINVTRTELENGIIPQNMVLCQQYYTSEGASTKSGIIYGVNTDLTYANPDEPTADFHASSMAEVAMKVVKLPRELYFNPEDERSMPWLTEMELCEDDLVWSNPIEVLNAVTLVCEGVNYKIIPYHELICAKREIWVDKWKGTKKDVVIMLNGYVLCTEIKKKAVSSFDVTSQDRFETDRAMIAFTGEPNKQYLNPTYVEFTGELNKCDEVLLDRKYHKIYLERVLFASKFDDKQLYLVVPRRRIAAKL
jgi:hypothetical protein